MEYQKIDLLFPYCVQKWSFQFLNWTLISAERQFLALANLVIVRHLAFWRWLLGFLCGLCDTIGCSGSEPWLSCMIKVAAFGYGEWEACSDSARPHGIGQRFQHRLTGDVMSQYLPFAGEHSIQEAVVSVHFRGRIPPQLVGQARDTAKAELEADLPKEQEIHQIESIVSSPNEEGTISLNSGSPHLAGFERSKVQADAKPARVLRLLDDILTVSFLEYPRWESALKDSLHYIQTVLPPLDLAANPIMAFSLRYIDRYTFDGPADEPRAEMLLRKGSDYITPYSFNAGSFWHCHSGWFEGLSEGSRILNQVNVSSALEDQVPMIVIDHNAIFQLKVPRQSIETLFRSSEESMGVEIAMNLLHERNVEMLRDMLQTDMLKRIGMQT